MSRLVLEKGRQKQFLQSLSHNYGLRWKEIAEICNVSIRTISEWRKERFKISNTAVMKLHEITGVSLPKPQSILPDHWNVSAAAMKGGRVRCLRHGNPGTAEGRKRGGYASRLGERKRINISFPSHSVLLAEFIGIMLGDGGVTSYQARITFNRDTDAEYADYICRLIQQLFNICPSIISKKQDKGNDIVVSSVNLVKFLGSHGLPVGSKISNHIDIPVWIRNKPEYMISCLRGLIDTDGSVYAYAHKVNGKIYHNFALCFTSYSEFLLKSVFDIFVSLGFSPRQTIRRVYLNKKMDIERYFDIINSHNQKHINKYLLFKKRSLGDVA